MAPPINGSPRHLHTFPGAGDGALSRVLLRNRPALSILRAMTRLGRIAAGAVLLTGLCACGGGSGGHSAAPPNAATSAEAAAEASAAASAFKAALPPPAAADFRISLLIMKKKCFGSAGCNVTYRIKPAYVGDDDATSVMVTYEVRGGEDGPQINTFTIDDAGTASFDSEETISTSTSLAKLTARATAVQRDT